MAFHTAATLAWNVKELAQPPWARLQVTEGLPVQEKLPFVFECSSTFVLSRLPQAFSRPFSTCCFLWVVEIFASGRPNHCWHLTNFCHDQRNGTGSLHSSGDHEIQAPPRFTLPAGLGTKIASRRWNERSSSDGTDNRQRYRNWTRHSCSAKALDLGTGRRQSTAAWGNLD